MPCCGTTSHWVHSRYTRTLADLPGHGRPVAIRLRVRRFRCQSPDCPQTVLCERLPDFVGPHARVSDRLTEVHRLVGLAPEGEAGARLAGHLAVPTSPDTILRRVKDAGAEPAPPPRFVGIDDWAWRKGQRNGAIVVDLERGRVAADDDAFRAAVLAQPFDHGPRLAWADWLDERGDRRGAWLRHWCALEAAALALPADPAPDPPPPGRWWALAARLLGRRPEADRPSPLEWLPVPQCLPG